MKKQENKKNKKIEAKENLRNPVPLSFKQKNYHAEQERKEPTRFERTKKTSRG